MSIETLPAEPVLETKINIYDLYDRFKDDEPFYTGACLAGLDTPEAWEIRKYQLDKKFGRIEARRGTAQGLAGLTDTAAYELRLEFLAEAPECVARSLSGDDSPEAWRIRDELASIRYIKQLGVAEGLAESLANIDTPRAWALRETLIPLALYNVFEGLAGVDSERAWELREKHKAELPMAVAGSLIGLTNARADQVRSELSGLPKIGKLALLVSRVGQDNDETWALREKYLDKNPFIVGTSLVGLKNKRADKFRQTLLAKIDRLEAKDDLDPVELKRVRKGFLQGLNSNYIWEALQKKK